jgi:hypothetical protein
LKLKENLTRLDVSLTSLRRPYSANCHRIATETFTARSCPYSPVIPIRSHSDSIAARAVSTTAAARSSVFPKRWL